MEQIDALWTVPTAWEAAIAMDYDFSEDDLLEHDVFLVKHWVWHFLRGHPIIFAGGENGEIRVTFQRKLSIFLVLAGLIPQHFHVAWNRTLVPKRLIRFLICSRH